MVSKLQSSCGLAGVPASTHNPHLVRDTMLHRVGHGEFPRCPTHISGKDINLTYHMAMSAETTLPTGIDPAAWFVPTAARGAGLGGVVLILEHQPYPFSGR